MTHGLTANGGRLSRLAKTLAACLLVLAAIAAASLLQPLSQRAYADDYSGTVYISLSHDGLYVPAGRETEGTNNGYMAYVPVDLAEVAAVDLSKVQTATGIGIPFIYEKDPAAPTMLKLFVYVLDKYNVSGTNELVVQGSTGSTYLKKGAWGSELDGSLWDENLNYYLNAAFPLERPGWGATSDQIVLHDGDYVDVSHWTDWQSPWGKYSPFGWFMKPGRDARSGSVVHEYAATAGVPLTVKVGHPVSGFSNGAHAGIAIHTGTGYNTDSPFESDIVTDENGEAIVTFDEPGTFYVWADGYRGPNDEGKTVITSSAAIAKVTVSPAAGSRVERLAGTAESGAAGTAAAIAAEAFAGQKADTVVIARNDDYHDALAGAGLAGALGAPILLTDRGGLSQACSDEIEALGATKAVILGGPSAITPQVEADLEAAGLSVDRLGGADVYGTSMAINERLVSMAGANADQAIVVNPTTFADALSISGWAYANRVPVMLQTWGGTAAERGFDDEAKAILQGRHLIVCGGEGAVSSASVSAIDPGFERLGGDTIYDTSLAIAGWELSHGMSAKDVTVASAIPDYNGVDALAGSALAGRAGGVTLLAQSNEAFGWYDGGEAALGFVRDHASEVQRVHVLGGAVASTPALYDAIREALGEDPAEE